MTLEVLHQQQINEKWLLTVVNNEGMRHGSSDWEFNSKLKLFVWLKKNNGKLKEKFFVKEYRVTRIIELIDEDLIIIPITKETNCEDKS